MENRTIINRLYELMLEANLNKPNEEVLVEIEKEKDPDVDKYLSKIQFYRTKSKSVINKNRFSTAKDELVNLINEYQGRLSEMFSGDEYELLLRFHRNYKESTKKDEQSMMENKKLLDLLKKFKNDLDENQKG